MSVLTGNQVQEIFELAKKKFAHSVNVIGSSSINTTLETAAKLNAVIIQFSNGGGSFNAGKGLGNIDQIASIKGSIAEQSMCMNFQKNIMLLYCYIPIMLLENFYHG